MANSEAPESVRIIAFALRQRRRLLGLTQLELAQKANVSLSTVNQVEGLKRIDPEFGTLERLADALGSNIELLLEAGRKGLKKDYSYVRLAVGRKIRGLRLERELTKQQLAVLAGISHTYVGMVEEGRTSVSIDKLACICSVFDVSLSRLLDGCGP